MPKYNGVSIEFVALDNGGNSIGTNSNSDCSISIFRERKPECRIQLS